MKPPPEAEILIRACFNGDATPLQLQRLESWLREDSAHVGLFVDLALLDGLLLTTRKSEDTSAILAVLLEAEEAAKPPLVTIGPEPEPELEAKPVDHRSEPIPFRHACYVLGQIVLERARSRAAVISGIAAVLLIALILGLVFSSGQNGPSRATRVVETPPAPPTMSEPVIVATLTAEQDARWAATSEGILPGVGDGLHAGLRLTLTHGFAEITTNRGAVATLEAPCTIELTGHDNALRLIRGSLHGHVATAQSSGFTVELENGDRFVDLGTAFHVTFDGGISSIIRVSEGSVRWESSDQRGQPVTFEQGEAGYISRGRVASAAYLETFPNPSAIPNDWVSLDTVGWSALVYRAGRVIDYRVESTGLDAAAVAQGSYGYVATERDPQVTDRRVLAFTAEPGPVAVTSIDSIAWGANADNTDDQYRVAIRHEGVWYASDRVFNDGQTDPGHMGTFVGLHFRPSDIADASNWRLLLNAEAGATAPIALGPGPESDLSGEVSAFGLLLDGGANDLPGDHIRFDDYTIFFYPDLPTQP